MNTMKLVTPDNYLINNYVKCAWAGLVGQESHRGFENFGKRYREFLVDLVKNSQLPSINLIMSLYFLYKYTSNVVNTLDKQDYNMLNSLIVMSMIISNKSYDDQCYTLKTWLNILEQQSCKHASFTLPLLNELEQHFLNVINYKSSFTGIGCDHQFWSALKTQASGLKVPPSVIAYFKALVCESPDIPPMAPGLGLHNSHSLSHCSTPTLSNRSSPIMSVGSNSSVLVSNYSPLTPLTPCVQVLDSIKKRKYNPIVNGMPKSFAIPSDTVFRSSIPAKSANIATNNFINYCI